MILYFSDSSKAYFKKWILFNSIFLSMKHTAFIPPNPFWHKFIPQVVHVTASGLPSVIAKRQWSPYPCSSSKWKMHLIRWIKLNKSAQWSVIRPLNIRYVAPGFHLESSIIKFLHNATTKWEKNCQFCSFLSPPNRITKEHSWQTFLVLEAHDKLIRVTT